MPYIATEERPDLDQKVETLAEEISEELSRGINNDTEISLHYRCAFAAIAKTLSRLERGEEVPNRSGRAEGLALEIYGEGPRRPNGERGTWLGRLNYALTRLIQVVPQKMVERGAWKEGFRYWVYAQTVGALARTAMEVHASGGEGNDGWPVDGLVGVLVDVKDEYKRRVNAAYETFQIRRSGDCYDTRYRTEVTEVRDASGRVVGYSEVMKDLGTGLR